MQKQKLAKNRHLVAMNALAVRPKRQNWHHTGFTIVEIVVTIAVFAIILPAIAGMIISLNTINDRARELSMVHAVAQNKIEELRSKGFIAVANGTVDFTSELPDALSDPSAQYTVSLADSADPSLKQVVIDISYDDHGETRALQYQTYLGELGVGQY